MTGGSPPALLEVRDLVVAYGHAVAVHGISFVVPEGGVVSLIGANGAGKTTTLETVAGLLRPRSGSIQLAGMEVAGRPAHDLVARGLVLVPEGRQILGQLTVEENLLLGAYQRKDAHGIRDDLIEIYRRFPVLQERRTLAAGGLSGGEQQMLAIARGLLARPRLLLLDEPSIGLAPLLVNEVFRALENIHASGTTLLLVEQNAHKALALSGYAYVLQMGRIALEGPAADLTRDQGVIAAYLGTTRIEDAE